MTTNDPNAQTPLNVGEPTPAPIDPVPTDPERFARTPADTVPGDMPADAYDRDDDLIVSRRRAVERDTDAPDLIRNPDGTPTLAFTTHAAAISQAEGLGGSEDDVYQEGVAFGIRLPADLANLTPTEWLARYPRPTE